MNVGIAALWLAGLGQGGGEMPPPVVHEQRLDDVGPVLIKAPTGDAAAKGEQTVSHRGLPTGSFAEVTELTGGRTIIALVEQEATPTGSGIGSLSAAAARALGLNTGTMAAVRIRPAVPSPAEQAAVRAGNVVTRLDAPATLLTALRRRMPGPIAPVPVAPAPVMAAPVTATPVKPASRPKPAPAPAKPSPAAAVGRWFVQVAALSDAARAASLAKSVDGVVRSAGRLYRVQAGPFATRAAAETARASIARRGFGDARIIAQD